MLDALNKAKQPMSNISNKMNLSPQQARLAALLAAQSNQPMQIDLNNMATNRP